MSLELANEKEDKDIYKAIRNNQNNPLNSPRKYY
jgi:hypothetical protein